MCLDVSRVHFLSWWNPMGFLWGPVLALLEPFALDLWRDEIGAWLPARSMAARRRSFFGGLYQQLVLTNGE